jgi:DNA polymerase-1
MKPSVSTSPFDLTKPEEWGPTRHGLNLRIDDVSALAHCGLLCACDVEDDERGAFVGLGVWDGIGPVLYFSALTDGLRSFLEKAQFVGHNFKSDLHKLKTWGVAVHSGQLVFDTMVASYVTDSTKESHGLKELAKQELAMEYPDYALIVGKGRAKRTLDTQPVALVAAYNGMDCVATWKLYQKYLGSMSKGESAYFQSIELPITRLLFDMEQEGITVDVEYLRKLDTCFAEEARNLTSLLRGYVVLDKSRLSAEAGDLVDKSGITARGEVNLNSIQQVKSLLLRPNAITVEATNKEALRPWAGVPLVSVFTRYREVEKLRNTYTSAFLELGSLPRIHTTFNQIAFNREGGGWKGIRTGRLSSSNPNLQNLSTRTQTGNLLRRCFVPRAGRTLICADYGQIEPRLMAHASQDRNMMEVFERGEDYYDALERLTKRKRKVIKTFAMATNYGAGKYKVSEILKCSVEEAEAIGRDYQKAFPRFFWWKSEFEKKAVRDKKMVTMLGRTIPVKDDMAHLCVPWFIQGSAAEIMKKAMLDVTTAGYRPICTVHDEMLFESLPEDAEAACRHIKRIMENVVKLSVTLLVEPSTGRNWAEAK